MRWRAWFQIRLSISHPESITSPTLPSHSLWLNVTVPRMKVMDSTLVSSSNLYFISTLQRQYDIWSSDDQSYKCSCFSAFFFPDVVCITPNPSSADKFYPFPFNLDCTSTSIPGKVMNERKLIPFDLAFRICGNFRHVLGFRYFLIWRGFSCGISSPCGIFCWTIFGGYLCRCAFES